MRVAVFSAKPYDRQFLDEANREPTPSSIWKRDLAPQLAAWLQTRRLSACS